VKSKDSKRTHVWLLNNWNAYVFNGGLGD
jgi:hypothetical protein